MMLSHMGKGLQIAPLISHTPLLKEGPGFFSDMASNRIWYNKVVFVISDKAKLEINSGKI
jgi:L-iditol 2-dehydrogenase